MAQLAVLLGRLLQCAPHGSTAALQDRILQVRPLAPGLCACLLMRMMAAWTLQGLCGSNVHASDQAQVQAPSESPSAPAMADCGPVHPQMLEEQPHPALSRLAVEVLQPWQAGRQGAAVLQRCQACQSTCLRKAVTSLDSSRWPLAADWLRTAHAAQRLLASSSTQQREEVAHLQILCWEPFFEHWHSAVNWPMTASRPLPARHASYKIIMAVIVVQLPP